MKAILDLIQPPPKDEQEAAAFEEELARLVNLAKAPSIPEAEKALMGVRDSAGALVKAIQALPASWKNLKPALPTVEMVAKDAEMMLAQLREGEPARAPRRGHPTEDEMGKIIWECRCLLHRFGRSCKLARGSSTAALAKAVIDQAKPRAIATLDAWGKRAEKLLTEPVFALQVFMETRALHGDDHPDTEKAWVDLNKSIKLNGGNIKIG